MTHHQEVPRRLPSASRRHWLVFALLVCLLAVSAAAQNFLSARIIAPPELPAGAGILASGDVNRDAIDDVIFSQTSGLGVAFGSTSGFKVSATYLPGLYCREAKIADMNGDGKPDLIVAIGASVTARLAVLLNNGDGAFSAPVITTVTTGQTAWPVLGGIGIGDFDGDKIPDVIVSDLVNPFLFVLHGNGDGSFRILSSDSDYFQGTHTIADLNHDGKLDLVVAHIPGSAVFTRLGNGDGTFQPLVPLAGSYNYYPMLADFNGDGILDLVDTAFDGSTGLYSGVVFLGNGDGTFTQSNSYFFSSTQGAVVDIRDLDEDGKLDLIMASENGYVLLLGQGDGRFGAPVTYSVPQWGGGGAAVGDFDGDGQVDIVGAVTVSDPVAFMLKGFPDAGFNGAATLDVGATIHSAVMKDLNGDGLADLVADTGSGTYVSLSNGDGTFRASSDSIVLGEQLLIEDFDRDGVPDALYVPSSPYSSLNFRRGLGNGAFALPVQGLSLYHGASYPAAADFNGDGKLDLTGITDSFLNVWQGNGDGSFAAPVSYFLPSATNGYCGGGDIIATDLNGDGSPDLMVAFAGLVNVFLNADDGSGTIVPGSAYPGCAFVVADLNNDQKMDLLAIQPSSQSPPNQTTIAVYLGGGSGQFVAASTINLPEGYGSIQAADLTHDGNVDLILNGADAVAVLAGDGKGGFGPELRFLAGDGPQTAFVADVNQDGAPDLIFPNVSGASPAPKSFSILYNRAGARATLAYTVNPAQYGQPNQLVASVEATVLGSGIPSGEVQLTLDQQSVPEASLVNGAYRYSLPILEVANHVAGGQYTGSTSFVPRTLSPVTLTVTKADTNTALTSGANPIVYGTTISFTARVQPAYAGAPTGTVTMAEAGTALSSAALDASGTATLSVTGLGAGTHALTAAYSGDGNFLASTSPLLNQSVRYPTTTIVGSSLTPALVGSTVTLTATVASAYANPAGTVTFADGNASLGQATIAAGKAGITITNLAVGIHNIAASYPGDEIFMGSDSTVLRQSVTDFSVTAQNASATMTAGSTANYTLTLASLAGFSGSVALHCSGAPQFSTCRTSPSAVSINGAPVSVSVSVSTTGARQTALRTHRNRGVMAFSLFATVAILFLAPSTRRKRLVNGILIVSMLALLVSCGGGSSKTTPPPWTPAGTSTLTVTATTTAGSVTVSHNVLLTLTVN
jgi:Bacterial Ig-like domain (group 3)/FG-GAP-like repeat